MSCHVTQTMIVWPHKYVSFNSRYSKMHFLYTHHPLFLQLLGFLHWSQDLTFGGGKISPPKRGWEGRVH